ncbi:N-acetyltransferase [Actinopolyspora erythraea]|uniref:GCN5 family acetyltransferase n=1 Tax=Actinopolyspora erythraea TaxID=414996 RepID=A0A099DC43_9ACTN|nr:GNAT family N-acetyltransferase [Actinopolyspora erythraea]ASU80672.1 N-acetyltransferase [Actinopolyspora erythraea]KGI82960.1 GCN5 family acetyltransferase [Actinopolyspora erythraea]
MTRRVIGLELDELPVLPSACRGCVFWELTPEAGRQAAEFGQTELEKEAWISAVLLEWGRCGHVAYVDGAPAGYVLYAPPGSVPAVRSFPSGPVGSDAVLLTALRVENSHVGNGLGRLLVREAARDLAGRGVRAVEAFGAERAAAPCVLPAAFLRGVGFETVRPHPEWPRLRLELDDAISWKEEVEAALRRLSTTFWACPTPQHG